MLASNIAYIPLPPQVFGWDTTNNSYDMDETDGRSYISAVSEIVLDPTQTCEGNAKNTMGEARMVSTVLLCVPSCSEI